jgi:hypothetical protein
MTQPDQVLAELPLKSGMVLQLTPDRVFGRADEGVFGCQDLSIPLSAISSISNGWRRFRILLLLGLLFLIAGLFSMAQGGNGLFAVALGLMLIVVFFGYRRHGIEIRSSSAVLFGQPVATEAATTFMSALISAQRRA